MNVYERETKEIIEVTIRRDRDVLTEGIFFAVKRPTARPTESDWVPAILTAEHTTGMLIDDLDVGTYMIWYRVVSPPQDVIKRAGLIRVV